MSTTALNNADLGLFQTDASFNIDRMLVVVVVVVIAPSISFRFIHTLGVRLKYVFKLVCTEILGRTDLSCRKQFSTLGCPGFVICMHIFSSGVKGYLLVHN